MPDPAAAEPAAALTGRLYFFVAFDWGDEIDLPHAGRLAPGEVLDLSRRSRTPTSIAYKPPPLRFRLQNAALALPEAAPLTVEAAEATVFDFGAVGVGFRADFRATPAELTALAGRFADRDVRRALVAAACEAVTPLYEKLLPAVVRPLWNKDLWEEYFVFHFPPGEPLTPDAALAGGGKWLAGLLRLEDQPLSDQEAAEAVRLTLRYGAADLFVPDWAACVLLDDERECSETLQVIEFANLQLLEYRHIDGRLDANLSGASALIERAGRSRLPLWARHATPLRALGQLRVEATGLFERTGNVLKLVGDPYLARVYQLLATRFHLGEWEGSIQRKLDVIEDIYQVVSDQTVAFRTEFLEVIVIILIVVEIALSLFRR
jgi:hypothetical protein